MSNEVKGTCAGKELGPMMHEKGEVSYVAAFPGTFVTHTEADARENAETFRHLRTICVYRIEIVDVYEQKPLPVPPAPPPADPVLEAGEIEIDPKEFA